MVTPASIQTLKEKLSAAYDVPCDSKKMISLLETVNACIHQEHLVSIHLRSVFTKQVRPGLILDLEVRSTKQREKKVLPGRPNPHLHLVLS